MKIKKLVSLSVAAAMALSIVACGSSTPTDNTTGST